MIGIADGSRVARPENCGEPSLETSVPLPTVMVEAVRENSRGKNLGLFQVY